MYTHKDDMCEDFIGNRLYLTLPLKTAQILYWLKELQYVTCWGWSSEPSATYCRLECSLPACCGASCSPVLLVPYFSDSFLVAWLRTTVEAWSKNRTSLAFYLCVKKWFQCWSIIIWQIWGSIAVNTHCCGYDGAWRRDWPLESGSYSRLSFLLSLSRSHSSHPASPPQTREESLWPPTVLITICDCFCLCW